MTRGLRPPLKGTLAPFELYVDRQFYSYIKFSESNTLMLWLTGVPVNILSRRFDACGH